MSFESYVIALHHSRAKGTALHVLYGIANHDSDGGSWPSIRTLAKYARCDPRSVQRHLQTLQQLGEIRVLQQAGGTSATPDHRRPNRYEFLLECPYDCDRSRQHRTLKQRLFDRLDPVTPASPGDATVTPPGDATVTPPGDATVTRTTTGNPPCEDNPTGLRTQPQSEQAPVDNHRCDKGWSLDEDDEGRRRPCLVCKPHLAARR